MKRKILSILLAFVMTLTLLPTSLIAAEPTYSDTKGHWAEDSIERWSGHGIIQGSNGEFDPNGQLTCAQLATILAKLLKLPAAKDAGFTDNTADAWYYDAINRCAAAGILNGNGDGTVTPEAPITRERAMVMLGRALGIEPISKPDLTKYTDSAKVAPYAQGMVAAMIEAGIVGGVTADELAPQDNINRASTVTILDRAIGTYADEAGATVKADGEGIVLVVADDVTVTGDVDKLLVPADNVEVTVSGSKNIDDITVTGDNSKVILNNSTANDVTLDGKNTELETKSGSKVENVSVTENAKGATVNAGSGTTVKNVENSAAAITVTGSGTVKNVASDTDITVETKNTNVENSGDEKITVTDAKGKDSTVSSTGSGSSTVVNKETTSSGGGYSHSHSYVYTDNGDGTHTGKCYANDSTLAPEEHTIVNGKCTRCGAEQTDAAVASVKKSDGTYAYYTTLADAIAEAGENTTVTLVKDAKEDITVSGGKTITIDLNGKKLTNNSGDTIVVEIGATLTVTGSGTVDNVTHGKAAIYNNGTVILNGGSYTRSAEASTSIEDANGNSYYNILNHGTMTIGENVSVTSSGHFSSLIANGYYNFSDTNPRSGYVSGTNQESPQLTINGGTFSGGINTIKNDDNATLTVNNGSFSNMTQAAIQNNHVATINGGTFDANAHHAIENRHFDGDHNTGSIIVTNGIFTGELVTTEGATWSITGGTFSSDPSAYVAEGYVAKEASEGSTWTVREKTWKDYPADASVVPSGLVITEYPQDKFDSNNGKTGTITIKDKEALLYFAYTLDPAKAYAECGEKEHGRGWGHTCVWYGNAFERHIVLDADIDLGGMTLENGFGNMKDFTFDGQGHKISNATINYTGTGNTGLFVGGNRGISDLVVENVKVTADLNGTENAAGIVSSDANALITNVTVRNSSVTGGKYTGAIVGYNYGSVTNCKVENCTVSGRYKVGGIIGYICNSNDVHTSVTGNSLTNVAVKAENVLTGKTAVIGKIVGNWNATIGECYGNSFDGTTEATGDIGEIESRCTNVTTTAPTTENP